MAASHQSREFTPLPCTMDTSLRMARRSAMSTEAPWTRVPARRRGPCHRAHAPLKETSSSRKLLADHASEGNHRQAAIVKFLSLHGLELLLGRWLEEGEAVVANRGVCVARRRDVDGAKRMRPGRREIKTPQRCLPGRACTEREAGCVPFRIINSSSLVYFSPSFQPILIGKLNLLMEASSRSPTSPSTVFQFSCSGVAWKARYDGVVTEGKRGWNPSATKNPRDASMATRPCFNSASRLKRTARRWCAECQMREPGTCADGFVREGEWLRRTYCGFPLHRQRRIQEDQSNQGAVRLQAVRW